MDQQKYWNGVYIEEKLQNSSEPSKFAREVLSKLKHGSTVLELGCGTGEDAVAFAHSGYQVTTVDFSDVIVKKNKERYKNVSNLNFLTADISKPLTFQANQFDAVYARLSLHYFTDKVTKQVFNEINRVLKPQGLLLFICKSTKDDKYGKGERIEQDMYENNGHIRHFFSEEYTRSILDGKFKIESLEEGRDIFYNQPSAYIKVIVKVI